MAITLARLLTSAESTYHIDPVAGRDGTKALVRWVHILEDWAAPDFLHGNELVFTTGIAQQGNQWLMEFVTGLKAHAAVGLVVNLGPYVTDIPQSVIDYCNRNDFPLFTIPWERRLTDVTYDLCHRIIASEENETGMVDAFRAFLFAEPNQDSYLPLLARRGFYSMNEYTLMLLDAHRGALRLAGEEWDSMKFNVQEAVLQCVDKPFFFFTQDNYLAIIGSGVTGTEMRTCAQRLQDTVFSEYPTLSVCAGISDTTRNLAGLNASLKQARAAAATSRLKNEAFLRYDELGLYQILHAVENQAVLHRFMDDVLGNMLRYDELHHTDHTAVLEAYLRNNGSIQQVSTQMGVHRNTINYKIKSMRDLFGLTLDNSDITSLWLALCIRETLRDTQSSVRSAKLSLDGVTTL
ncbi:MAG: Purine catabolism regulatory protein-like family [Oscillospiraceae bacterium]|nr:Purine catabolism regulatory protein-like family [Oscillospiraceae bacterium]